MKQMLVVCFFLVSTQLFAANEVSPSVQPPELLEEETESEVTKEGLHTPS